MRYLTLLILGLSACGSQEAAQKSRLAEEAPAIANAARMATTPAQSSMLMAVPTDKERLKQLAAMGYTVHDDHLHPPGVAACPKMADSPVQ